MTVIQDAIRGKKRQDKKLINDGKEEEGRFARKIE